MPAGRTSDLPGLVRARDEACAGCQDGAPSAIPPPPTAGPPRCSRALPPRSSQKAPPGTPSAGTSTSIDLKASVQPDDQEPRRYTPGGPITGNGVVPCSWQKTRQGGPMLMAGDTPVSWHEAFLAGSRMSSLRKPCRCPSSSQAPRQSPTARPTTDPRQAPCWASAWPRDARTQRLASSHRALAAGSSGGPREPHLKVQDAVHTITPGMRAPRRCHGRPPS